MGGNSSTFGEDGAILRDCDTLSSDLSLTLAYLVSAASADRGVTDHCRLLVSVEAAVLPSRVQCRFHFDLDSPLRCILAWI